MAQIKIYIQRRWSVLKAERELFVDAGNVSNGGIYEGGQLMQRQRVAWA